MWCDSGLLVGLFGVFCVGGCYVLLDLVYLEEWVVYMFDDVDCLLVLVDVSICEWVVVLGWLCLMLEEGGD